MAQSLDLDLENPQFEGSTINLTSNALGGTDLFYKFHLYNSWKVLREYGTVIHLFRNLWI